MMMAVICGREGHSGKEAAPGLQMDFENEGGRGDAKSLFYEKASGASGGASAENEGSLFKSAGAHG